MLLKYFYSFIYFVLAVKAVVLRMMHLFQEIRQTREIRSCCLTLKPITRQDETVWCIFQKRSWWSSVCLMDPGTWQQATHFTFIWMICEKHTLWHHQMIWCHDGAFSVLFLVCHFLLYSKHPTLQSTNLLFQIPSFSVTVVLSDPEGLIMQ